MSHLYPSGSAAMLNEKSRLFKTAAQSEERITAANSNFFNLTNQLI